MNVVIYTPPTHTHTHTPIKSTNYPISDCTMEWTRLGERIPTDPTVSLLHLYLDLERAPPFPSCPLPLGEPGGHTRKGIT